MVTPTMTFGKYKGTPIEDIPTPYLEWLLRMVNLPRWLETAAVEEIERRRNSRTSRNREERRRSAYSGQGSDGGRDGASASTAYPPPANFPEVLRKAHREMVMRFHPDRGGSHDAMVALNAYHERLMELVA